MRNILQEHMKLHMIFFGELKLTVRAYYLHIAVIGADLIVKRILGFIPTKLSIKEIEDKEK